MVSDLFPEILSSMLPKYQAWNPLQHPVAVMTVPTSLAHCDGVPLRMVYLHVVAHLRAIQQVQSL